MSMGRKDIQPSGSASMEPLIVGLEGHVYVVAFQSGVVKVGHSLRPQQRTSQYVTAGVIHGNPVVNKWISPPHIGAWDNERQLIQFCMQHGRLASGGERGEYFVGVDYEAVREFAVGLPLLRGDREEYERKGREGQEQFNAAANRFFGFDRVVRLPRRITAFPEVEYSESEQERYDELLSDLLYVGPEDIETLPAELMERVELHLLNVANAQRDVDFLESAYEAASAVLDELLNTGANGLRHEANVFIGFGQPVQPPLRAVPPLDDVG